MGLFSQLKMFCFACLLWIYDKASLDQSSVLPALRIPDVFL